MTILKKSLLLLPLLFLLSACSGNPESIDNMTNIDSNGYISIEKNNIDLNDIPILGGKVNIDYTFTNKGTEPVALFQGTTSCMCTEAVVESSQGVKSPRITMAGHGAIAKINQVLKPGETSTLIAVYDPMAHGPGGIGVIKRDVFIKTNSIKTPEIRFSFQGTVVK